MFKEKTARRPGRRTLFRVAIALVAPLLMTIVVANGTANAAWRNGEMYNLAKAQCLDGGGGWVSTWSCNGSAVQIWQDIQPSSSPYYELRDNAGHCLDGGQGNGLFGCNGLDWQLWSVEKMPPTGDGRTYYRFHWARNYGTCLDGGQHRQSMWFPCNGKPYQLWSWN
ncbi:RICIN domain-containing protein [Amycolatopsis sp. NPDC003676]